MAAACALLGAFKAVLFAGANGTAEFAAVVAAAPVAAFVAGAELTDFGPTLAAGADALTATALTAR
jgi:hypothetical protein